MKYLLLIAAIAAVILSGCKPSGCTRWTVDYYPQWEGDVMQLARIHYCVEYDGKPIGPFPYDI